MYIAVGEKYRDQAVQSAKRVSSLGDWPLCIITDNQTKVVEEVFDEKKIISGTSADNRYRYGGAIKPTYLQESPYDKTLYLDTDTYVVSDEAIDELFEVLNQYELAAAHDTHRNINQQYRNQPTPKEQSPPSFPWLNTGVVVYKNTSSVSQLFKDWGDIYHEQNKTIEGVNDQSAFVEALYQSDVDHTVLPPEYNHRTPFQQTLMGEVKIVHGHHDNLDEIAEFINKYISQDLSNVESSRELFQTVNHYTCYMSDGTKTAVPVRLQYSFFDEARITPFRIENNISKLRRSLDKNGIAKTARLTVKKFWKFFQIIQ